VKLVREFLVAGGELPDRFGIDPERSVHVFVLRPQPADGLGGAVRSGAVGRSGGRVRWAGLLLELLDQVGEVAVEGRVRRPSRRSTAVMVARRPILAASAST
jgi:hypothetical protein